MAHGGSIVFSASILFLLDREETHHGTERPLDKKVISVEIDIRAHYQKAIESHFLVDSIYMLEGSSIAPATVEQVKVQVHPKDVVIVFLNSNHTHDHVYRELVSYAQR
jgi:cephalosporin hydroxylase